MFRQEAVESLSTIVDNFPSKCCFEEYDEPSLIWFGSWRPVKLRAEVRPYGERWVLPLSTWADLDEGRLPTPKYNLGAEVETYTWERYIAKAHIKNIWLRPLVGKIFPDSYYQGQIWYEIELEQGYGHRTRLTVEATIVRLSS